MKTILIVIAFIFVLFTALYFMAKKINEQEQEIKELEQKEKIINEKNELKEKIDTGTNLEQFNSTLDVLQKLKNK